MFTTVFVGNSDTKVINNKMVTPRGYKKCLEYLFSAERLRAGSLRIFCHSNRIPAAVCVTTGLGKELLSSFNTLKIITGKKDYSQIVNMLEKEKYSAVLDATHPFAEKATENIKSV